MLESLPDSLDETYERMLCNIDSDLIDDARRILTLLCFSPTPMCISELIDGIAVDIEGCTGLNKKRRLQGLDDIHRICVGFVEIDVGIKHHYRIPKDGDRASTIRIAHFSIWEYLVSERIQRQRATIFSLNSVTTHAQIAQIYLLYLLEDGLKANLEEERLDQMSLQWEFPLAELAAGYWYHHYNRTTGPVPELDHLIIQLFQRPNSFVTWVELFCEQDNYLQVVPIITPLYYASLLGLTQVLTSLIDGQQEGSMNMSTLSPVHTLMIFNQIDADGGTWGNALQAVSSRGHVKMVQMLLDRGANVNAPGGQYGNALQVAAAHGYDKVVQMLLDKGANVKGKIGGVAIKLASIKGHDEVVQMLLDNGAEVSLTSELEGMIT